jgi:hypothetical protein
LVAIVSLLCRLNYIFNQGGKLVSEGRGRLFRRKDGKYLIYLPKDLAEDSMFPFKDVDSIYVKILFKIGEDTLHVQTWKEPEHERR